MSQGTLDKTICRAGWTSQVRPPEDITESEKRASLAAYGDAGPLSAYEYDHFIPLELGGAVNDPRNLWPEPGGIPNPKDAVENELNHRVCDGQVALAAAQREIAANWTSFAAHRSSGTTPHGGHCHVTASYNHTHHDYDVYVHSDQPDQTVTVTDSSGDSASWHTDRSGYADVYFHAARHAAGETITARVGRATCSAEL